MVLFLSSFLAARLAGQFPTVAGCGPPQAPHLAGVCLQAVPGLAGVYYPAGMFGALMEPRAYKTAWWAVPTGFEASVAQLAAPGADCIHSCFPVLLCPVPGTSEANAIDEEPPGLL